MMKKIFLLITFIALIGLLVRYLAMTSKTTTANAPQPSQTPEKPLKGNEKPTLGQTIQNLLTESQGTYGIVVKNLSTGETYYYNEHKVFKSASLYKLWVMGEIFNQIQNKNLNEQEVDSALEQMITVSDNYHAILLSNMVGLSNISNYLVDQKFNESSLGSDIVDPTTTPNDIALFFEKLYNRELENGDNTQKMLNLLKKQKINDRIPKYLPEGTIIAHKTGDMDTFSHDAGIIYTKTADYVIVLFSESESPEKAKEGLAQISKEVYKYFTEGG